MKHPRIGLALLLMSACALADVYKCTGDKGAIEFSDKPCAGARSIQSVKIQDSQLSGSGLEIPPDRQTNGVHVVQLDALVAKAITNRDFAKARELAVTRAQWEMISAAESSELRRKAEAAGNKPVVCFGSSVNHGRVTTSSAVCR